MRKERIRIKEDRKNIIWRLARSKNTDLSIINTNKFWKKSIKETVNGSSWEMMEIRLNTDSGKRL